MPALEVRGTASVRQGPAFHLRCKALRRQSGSEHGWWAPGGRDAARAGLYTRLFSGTHVSYNQVWE